jgi:Short repeat of unknown function (DUF308)
MIPRRRFFESDLEVVGGRGLGRPPTLSRVEPALSEVNDMMTQAAKATLPGWARALAIVVGVISLILAVVVLAFPSLAILTLVFLLAIAFLFIGIDRLLAGITGHPYYWLGPLMPPSGASSSSTGPPK